MERWLPAGWLAGSICSRRRRRHAGLAVNTTREENVCLRLYIIIHTRSQKMMWCGVGQSRESAHRMRRLEIFHSLSLSHRVARQRAVWSGKATPHQPHHNSRMPSLSHFVSAIRCQRYRKRAPERTFARPPVRSFCVIGCHLPPDANRTPESAPLHFITQNTHIKRECTETNNTQVWQDQQETNAQTAPSSCSSVWWVVRSGEKGVVGLHQVNVCGGEAFISSCARRCRHGRPSVKASLARVQQSEIIDLCPV